MYNDVFILGARMRGCQKYADHGGHTFTFRDGLDPSLHGEAIWRFINCESVWTMSNNNYLIYHTVKTLAVKKLWQIW